MEDLIRKSRKASLLMYHLVFVEKYRILLVKGEVGRLLRETWLEIAKHFELGSLEIGSEGDLVRSLIQSASMYRPSGTVK